jgi:penicillin amidase
MNPKLKFLISFTGLIGLILVLNNRIAILPPLGKFFDPYSGFWQNAEHNNFQNEVSKKIEGVKDSSTVVFDERLVPHIQANNLHDLYFLQGYITASHRLWQMETQTRAASGRLSEVLGTKTLEIDRNFRRLGLPHSAEKSLEIFKKDSLSNAIVSAYTDGVNAYIKTLNEASKPLEYKLLDYYPEPWSEIKCVLLLKYMANMLTVQEYDFENTNLLHLLGKADFDKLFPNFYEKQDPIIPRGTPYEAAAITPKAPEKVAIDTKVLETVPKDYPDNVGSNNWAVSGKKTATGYPILCNDPHLSLNLPSIWYECQMTMPGMNVYGASLPGAPAVIIGFNDSIAWGVTNGSMDVKDWYSIEFKDASKNEYKYEDKWRKTTKVVEVIKVRGQADVLDTVVYTHHGPVVYEKGSKSKLGSNLNLAVKWEALNPSNEMMTMYKLNKAKNYNDYTDALKHFQCPAQNFVYADAANNIAIWEQGHLPAKWKDQGRFVMDGSDPLNDWQGYIPQEHNPHTFNPERGFVSSANQHPTDESYPYWYSGTYEMYRNRRINNELARMNGITVDSMLQLQCDKYSLKAEETMPLLVKYLQNTAFKNLKAEGRAWNEIKKWNYEMYPGVVSPSIYKYWTDTLMALVWDEIPVKEGRMKWPSLDATFRMMTYEPNSDFFDAKRTKGIRENAVTLTYDAFYWTAEKHYDKVANSNFDMRWGIFKHTSIDHVAKIPALGVFHVGVGGEKNCVDAISEHHGPSWRMVVQLGPKVKAYGVYPGGQSGNPGSYHYIEFVDSWSNDKYYQLNFFQPGQVDPDHVLTKWKVS